MGSMLAAAGAKIVLILLAFVAIRLFQYVLDKAMGFSFKSWLEKMENEKPEQLVWYLGLRYLGFCIMAGLILG